MSFSSVLQLPLPSAADASNVVQILRVDPPLPGTTRTVAVDPMHRHILCITTKSGTMRALRMGVHAAMDQLDLVLRTMDAFNVPVSDKVAN